MISNHKRLLDLKQKIETNDSSDNVVKVVGGITMVLGTLEGILYRIRSIKKSVSMETGIVPRSNQRVITRPGVYGQTGI